MSSGGYIVASGTTLPFGPDAASGETVHFADFSSFKAAGPGFKLRVGGDGATRSPSGPTSTRSSSTTRSRTSITTAAASRSPCPTRATRSGRGRPGTRQRNERQERSLRAGSGCTYSLDVTGGWYDAGDHGKYVVNGGICVWTLLDQYERAKHLGKLGARFGDGKLNIPENKNGVPDILDEARWELEFMLKMQVPAGNPLAGMVHHKVHDEEWTALGTAPHEDADEALPPAAEHGGDAQPRRRRRAGARIWKTIDPAFAARCLGGGRARLGGRAGQPGDVSRRDATVRRRPLRRQARERRVLLGRGRALRHDGQGRLQGVHEQVAALQAVPAAPATKDDGDDLGETEALGTISLAVVPSGLDAADGRGARASIVGGGRATST